MLAFYHPPSTQILMEISCYRQINKLIYLYQKNLLSKLLIEQLYPIVIMLSDDGLQLLFDKIAKGDPSIKYILLSGKCQLIMKWLSNHSEIELDLLAIKQLLLLDDVEIIKQIKIPKKYLVDLIPWLVELDLLEVKLFLESL